MTKSKIVAPTLISCGLIIPELHFGPFSCNWWLEIITDNGQESFPICVGMSIVTELNGQNSLYMFLKTMYKDKFPLKLGCAIKGKQNLEKKVVEKIIVDFLKTYFHSGNYDKSQRYTPGTC
ncbi:1553_t:CDS:2 [Entrophospora sp. SA101]|nr:3143_t:CDS:2 [Entrophospora sp. SA101]CAJ0847355.1 1553_t:CDS:2 [Entrophospora sp. SA101]